MHTHTLFQDSSTKLLREEARVLSKGKQSVEQHLQTVKAHLQGLDGTRRLLQTKISSLSQALELDAQNFKVHCTTIIISNDMVCVCVCVCVCITTSNSEKVM